MSNTEIVTQETGLPEGYSEAQASLAVSLARAEVDQQVATARALPRVLSRVVERIQTLATLDEDTAEECVYALPRGGKPIKGPSIRLAEIIGTQWGNARVGARVVHVDRVEKFVEAEGVFHDLETNMATTARVRRRISDKNGKILTDDMIIVTGNAACSIAKRNAILGAVPKAVWRKAYDAVEKVIAGDVKTLAERREKAMKAFAAFGVTSDHVLAALGLRALDDIALEHMPVLAGMHSALKSGEATAEEMFFRPAASRSAVTGSLSERMAGLVAKPAPKHDPDTGEIQNDNRGADQHPKEAGSGAVSPRHDAPASDLSPADLGRSDAIEGRDRAPPEGYGDKDRRAYFIAYDAIAADADASTGA